MIQTFTFQNLYRFHKFFLTTLCLVSFSISTHSTPLSNNDPASQLKAYTQLAQQLLARQQLDSTWQQALKLGMPLLKQVSDTALVGRAFRVEVINMYLQQRNFHAVIKTAKPLILSCRQANDKPMEGRVRYGLCTAYSNLGMFQECITEALYTIGLFQQPPNHDILALTYTVLARAYQEQGDSARVNQYTTLSVRHGKLAERTNIRTVSFLNEGELLLAKGQFKKAIESYNTVLRIIETDPALTVYGPGASVGLAQAFEQNNQPNEAYRWATKATEEARLYGDLATEIESSLTLVRVQAMLKNNKASLVMATRALRLSNEVGVPPIARLTALKLFSEAQERMGNPTAALKATRQLAALTDSLNQINKAEAIATAETRFNVKAKNATIDLLNKNMALRQQQAQQEKQTALIVIASLVLGFLTVGFFWYRARKTSQLLQRQKAEIETQARQLAEINGIKDQLFSIVSHDLRGPVMSLQQGLDRLESATQASSDALPRFRQSVNAVASLTDNVLCWSLAQMGGLRTHPQPFGVVEVVEDVLTLYAPAIAQKNLRVVISPDLQRAASILADENQAEIVLRNIIQNAIQFSPVGGELRFEVEQQGDSQSLLVIDEGPGFEGQLSSGPQTKTSTGLGLQVVGDLMSRNGGSATFALRTDRSGTVVRLRWPSPHTIESGTALVGQPEKSVI